MTGLFLSALLALAPAPPAAAQYRVEPLSAPTVVSAPAPLASSPAAGLVPSLGASSFGPLAASPSSRAPALSAALPAPPAAPSSLLAPAPAAAPALAALPAAKTGPVVLHSLRELGALFPTPEGALASGGAFDGTSRVRGDASEIAVRPVRGGLSGFLPHEIAAIRKIQKRAPNLKILVPESAATPDVLVNGVVVELKSVHKGKLARQLEGANGQLLAHARRHGLGLGAVVMDVIGQAMTPAEIEAEIAAVVRSRPAIGFGRVYVFHGDELATYAPGPDGTFRLDPSAAPFELSPSAAR